MKRGQTLVLLLIFMAMAVTITTAAVVVIIVNSQMGSKWEQGEAALVVAESGAENALIRLLRDPTYIGETLTVGGGTATIVVTGANPTINVTGRIGNFSRQVRIVGTYAGGVLAVTSWREVWP
jgi:hypothetical protein